MRRVMTLTTLRKDRVVSGHHRWPRAALIFLILATGAVAASFSVGILSEPSRGTTVDVDGVAYDVVHPGAGFDVAPGDLMSVGLATSAASNWPSGRRAFAMAGIDPMVALVVRGGQGEPRLLLLVRGEGEGLPGEVCGLYSSGYRPDTCR